VLRRIRLREASHQLPRNRPCYSNIGFFLAGRRGSGRGSPSPIFSRNLIFSRLAMTRTGIGLGLIRLSGRARRRLGPE